LKVPASWRWFVKRFKAFRLIDAAMNTHRMIACVGASVETPQEGFPALLWQVRPEFAIVIECDRAQSLNSGSGETPGTIGCGRGDSLHLNRGSGCTNVLAYVVHCGRNERIPAVFTVTTIVRRRRMSKTTYPFTPLLRECLVLLPLTIARLSPVSALLGLQSGATIALEIAQATLCRCRGS
jgi:hypothetical protein